MKLLLLDGPGEVGSRKKLTALKESFDGEVQTYDAQITQVELNDLLSQQSLFSEKRLIILENPSESLTIEKLGEADLIIWLPKDIDQRRALYKSIKEQKGEFLNFPEGKEVSVFPFLDSLAEGKKSAFLELKKLNDGGYDTQYYLTMIFYLLRSLAVTPKNAPQFVRTKLQKQRTRFSPDKLTDFYRFALEIDFKIKSGLLEGDQAQFLLVNKFLS